MAIKVSTLITLFFLVFFPFTVEGKINRSPFAGELGYDPDNLVVKFSDQIDQNLIDILANDFGIDVNPQSDWKIKVLNVDFISSHPILMEMMEEAGIVEFVEPDYCCKIDYTPNDTYFFDQWHLLSLANGGVDAQLAWDVNTGNPNIIIAVVDTGVAFEDYSAYKDGVWMDFAKAPDFVNTNFVFPKNVIEDDDHPNDDQGHGTHVAGVIAQTTDNSYATAGLAFGCSIMPVKALDSNGEGYISDISDGIKYAADNGADVINLSFGSSSSSITLKLAVKYAYNKGCVVVAASGNEGDSGNLPHYPAAYDDYCIAVGSTNNQMTRSYFSNYGDYVDVVAPGELIYQQNFSTGNFTTFNVYGKSGTSFSAPIVSAIAGLLMSNGLTDRDMVWRSILESAIDLNSAGWDSETGWGLVNAYQAITYFVKSDFNLDGLVDMDDFTVIAEQWFLSGNDLEADMNSDGTVNLVDVALFAQHWHHNL